MAQLHLDPCVLARIVQLQKMDRPTVWSCDGSTFYKSWSTTLYYKNEAYVCGFVGMEVNKEKAFEVWHRRPDLDLAVTNNVSRPEMVATRSPTIMMQKKPAKIQNNRGGDGGAGGGAGRWTKKMEKQLTTAMKSPAMTIAMKSPTMKMKKTAMKAAMKMEKQSKAAMKKQAMKAALIAAKAQLAQYNPASWRRAAEERFDASLGSQLSKAAGVLGKPSVDDVLGRHTKGWTKGCSRVPDVGEAVVVNDTTDVIHTLRSPRAVDPDVCLIELWGTILQQSPKPTWCGCTLSVRAGHWSLVACSKDLLRTAVLCKRCFGKQENAPQTSSSSLSG